MDLHRRQHCFEYAQKKIYPGCPFSESQSTQVWTILGGFPRGKLCAMDETTISLSSIGVLTLQIEISDKRMRNPSSLGLW